MDKVKGMLKHGFWIAFVLFLPIVAYGYFSASSTITPAIKERSEELAKIESSVKTPTTFVSAPSEDYQVKLKRLADELEAKNLKTKLGLWEYQLGDMNWPPVIADQLEQRGLRGYRAIEKEENDPLITLRRKYAEGYQSQIQKLFQSFEPFVGEKYKGRDADWTQKVLISDKVIPQDRIQANTNVTAARMWDAQEDIWLTRILSGVVREMNAQADGINDAAIRKIDKLRLFGGTGEPQYGASAGGAYGGGGESSGGYDYGGSGGMPSGYDGGGYGGTASAKTKVDFDPAEVFGPASEGAGAAGGGYEYNYESSGSEGTAAYEPPKRYIGEVGEDAAFMERGFYMTLLIEESRLDEFLTTLSSTRWPIRIGRFQIGPNPYFKEQVKGPGPTPYGGTGGYPGGGEGYPGGGSGYPGGGSGYPGGGSGYPGGSDGGGEYNYGAEGGEYPGAGGGGFGVETGTAAAVNDPVAAAAISSSNLITLSITGAITMYAQPGEDVLADPTVYPVPIEGQPYEPPAQPLESGGNEVAMTDPKVSVSGTTGDSAASEVQ